MDQINNLRSILVSNTRPYSDSNSIAADLAGIISARGKRVLLIDADLRHPYMHKVFGIRNDQGLVEYLEGELPLSRVIRRLPGKRISLITAGNLGSDGEDLLATRDLQPLMQKLGIEFDKIIIHGPAFSYSEASSLAGLVDGLVLLVHPGHVKTQMYQSIVEKYQKTGTRIIGIVMRDQPKFNSNQSAFIDRLLTFDRQARQAI